MAHDGGVAITMNRGKNFLRVQLPIAQVYHVTVDNRVPYDVYGNKQDGTSYMGPSNSKLGAGGGIWRGLWRTVGGGESGFAIPDTVDSNLVWSSASGSGAGQGIVVRYNVATGIINNVEVWPDNVGGDPAGMVKYRFVWNFPLMVSPHDHNTVYTGSQMVHRTTNGGQSWDVISPDLTRNDKSKQGISGGLTAPVAYPSILSAGRTAGPPAPPSSAVASCFDCSLISALANAAAQVSLIPCRGGKGTKLSTWLEVVRWTWPLWPVA